MLQPRRNCSAVIILLGAISLNAQIRQSDNLRAEQAVTEQRLQQQARQEEQQHQAQIEQMQRVDRQQARDQHELDRQRELQAESQAQAAQQALIQQQLQDQTQQKEAQQQLQQQKAQGQSAGLTSTQPAPAVQSAQQPVEPTATPQWSWKNFTFRDEIGLAALGLLLGALAFKAGTPLRNRS